MKRIAESLRPGDVPESTERYFHEKNIRRASG